MNATDELRRMLDELGVEWEADDEMMDDGTLSQVTYWFSNGVNWSADGRDEYLAFDAVQLITPAQAITATLGPAAHHPKPHEQWTTVLLPEIAWGWGERWPDYLSVAHDANGEWRVYVPEATLGDADATRERQGDAGTCRQEEHGWSTEGDHARVWLTCGHDCMVETVADLPNFCPECGAKVVNE